MAGTRGYTVSTQDTLTSTAPVLPALSDYSLHHDTPGLPVQTLSVPPLSLGLLSAPQSLCTFHLTLANLAQCLFMQGSPLCTASTPGGDGNSTHPLSLHDAGTGATRS